MTCHATSCPSRQMPTVVMVNTDITATVAWAITSVLTPGNLYAV